MPNSPVTIRGGSMKIKVKKGKLEKETPTGSDHDYDHSRTDGTVTYVRVIRGGKATKDPMEIEITDSKNCEIEIGYTVP